MSVRIQLDKPYAYFTNLDYITGKVILSTKYDENISAILVKLEGESRTRLIGNADYALSEKSRTEMEIHKVMFYAVLYPDSMSFFV